MATVQDPVKSTVPDWFMPDAPSAPPPAATSAPQAAPQQAPLPEMTFEQFSATLDAAPDPVQAFAGMMKQVEQQKSPEQKNKAYSQWMRQQADDLSFSLTDEEVTTGAKRVSEARKKFEEDSKRLFPEFDASKASAQFSDLVRIHRSAQNVVNNWKATENPDSRESQAEIQAIYHLYKNDPNKLQAFQEAIYDKVQKQLAPNVGKGEFSQKFHRGVVKMGVDPMRLGASWAPGFMSGFGDKKEQEVKQIDFTRQTIEGGVAGLYRIPKDRNWAATGLMATAESLPAMLATTTSLLKAPGVTIPGVAAQEGAVAGAAAARAGGAGRLGAAVGAVRGGMKATGEVVRDLKAAESAAAAAAEKAAAEALKNAPKGILPATERFLLIDKAREAGKAVSTAFKEEGVWKGLGTVAEKIRTAQGQQLAQSGFWTTQIAPDLEQKYREMGMDPTAARFLSLGVAAVEGAIENLNARQMLVPLLKKSGAPGVVKTLFPVIAQNLREGGEEWLQPMAELLGDRAAAFITGKDFSWSKGMESVNAQARGAMIPVIAMGGPGAVGAIAQEGIRGAQRGAAMKEAVTNRAAAQERRTERQAMEQRFKERGQAALNEPPNPQRSIPAPVAAELEAQRQGNTYAPGVQAKLDEIRAKRAKGYSVSVHEGQELGLNPEQMKNRESRNAAVDQLLSQAQEQQNAGSLLENKGVPEEAGRPVQGSQVPSGGDLRAGGQVEGGAKPAGEVTPAQEVQVAPKVGDTRKDELGVEQVFRMVDPNTVGFTEPTKDVENSPEVEEYTRLAKEGSVPPPVDIVWNEDSGKPVTTNRRRVMAAQRAGTLVPAWVDKKADENLFPTKPTPPAPTPVEAQSDIDRAVAAAMAQVEAEEAAPPVKSKGRTKVPKPAKESAWDENSGRTPTSEELSARVSQLDAAIVNAKEAVKSVRKNNAAVRKATPKANTSNFTARVGDMKMRESLKSAQEYLAALQKTRQDVVAKYGEPAKPAKSKGKRDNDIVGKEVGSAKEIFAEEDTGKPKTYEEAVRVISSRGVMSPRDMKDTAKLNNLIKVTWGLEPPVTPTPKVGRKGAPKKPAPKNVSEVAKFDAEAEAKNEAYRKEEEATQKRLKGISAARNEQRVHLQIFDEPVSDRLRADIEGWAKGGAVPLRVHGTKQGKPFANTAGGWRSAKALAQQLANKTGSVHSVVQLRDKRTDIPVTTVVVEAPQFEAIDWNPTNLPLWSWDNALVAMDAGIEHAYPEPKKPAPKNVAEVVKAVAAQGEQEKRGTVSEAPKVETGPVEFGKQTKGNNAPGVETTVLARSGDRILHIEKVRHHSTWSIVQKGRYTGDVKGTKTKDEILASGIDNLRKAKDVATRIMRGEFDPEGDLRFEKKDTKNLSLNNSRLADEVKSANVIRVDAFASLVQDRGWMTDGKMLVKLSDADKKAVLASIGKFTSVTPIKIDDILKSAEKATHYSGKQMTPVAYRGGDLVRREVALQSKDGTVITVDKSLHDTVMKRHPKAVAYGPTDLNAVAYKEGDEIVGVIMPIKADKPDSHLKSLEKGTYWDQPMSQPTRQTSPELQAAKAEKDQARKELIRKASKLKSLLPGSVDPELALAAVKYVKAAVKFEIIRFKDLVKDLIRQTSKERALELDEYLQSAWKQQGAKDPRLDKPTSVQAVLNSLEKKAKAAPKAEKVAPAPKSNWQDSVLSALSGKTKVADAVELPTLWAQVEKANPGLTMEEFKQGLLKLHADGKIRLEDETGSWEGKLNHPLAIRGKDFDEKRGYGLKWWVRGVEAPVESPMKNPVPPPVKEAAPKVSGTVGTKNAKTDELRDKMGLPPRDLPERESVNEMDAEAARRMKADPALAGRLAEELTTTPRAVSEVEDFILKRHINDLKNQRNAGKDVDDELLKAIDASELVGTIWGRMGVARQVEMNADFSLEGLIRKHFKTVGEAPSKEMLEKLEEMAKRIEQQDAEIAELRKRKTEEEIDALIEEALKNVRKPAPKEKIGTKKERIRKQISEGVSAFKTAWSEAVKAAGSAFTTSGGLNPEALAALGRAAKAAAGLIKSYAELGVESFLELTARIKQDIGDITAEQTKIFREEWDKQFANVESPMGEEPSAPMIGAQARELARWAVESGIRGRQNVVQAVHDQLTAWGVEQDIDTTAEAIAGYGDFRPLAHDEVSDLVRGYKDELRKEAQLRAMQRGEAPLRSGVEQGEPTEEGRQLQKQVNEAKKKGGYVVTDPQRQLKSALDTAKTTVENAITDTDLAIAELEKAIKDKTPLEKPDERTPGPTDTELDEMRAELARKRAQRKDLKEQYDKIFPPKRGAMTDAKRLEMAEKLMTRLNEKLAADIAAGRLTSKEPNAPLTSPTLTRQKALNDALKAALKAAREASPAYQAQLQAKEDARYLKDLQRQEAFWNKRKEEARAGILQKAKPKKTRTNKQILDAMIRRDKTQREALAEIEAEKRRRWDLGEKIYAGLGEVSTALPRELMAGMENSVVLRQGWFFTMQWPFHPVVVFSRILDGLQSIFSERIAKASQEDIRQRPNFPEYRIGDIAEDPLGPKDELYQSRIVDWLASTENILWFPARWAAKAYIGTARGFRTFSNGMKADIYDIIKHDTMQGRRFFNKYGNKKVAEWTESDTKLTGRSANIFGGRGTGLKEGGLKNYVLWAPKWIWSRIQAEFILPFQIATPQFIGRWNGDAAIRLAHARFYAQAAVGAALHLAALYFTLALLADDDEDKPTIEFDTTSTDLLKLKIRDTRIDVMGGLPQYFVFFSRLLQGVKKTPSGEVVELRGENANPFKGDMWDEITKQVRYKLGPTASGAVDFFTGETAVGEKLPDSPVKRVGAIAARRLVPMTWPDIFEAEKSLGLKQGTVAAIEAFMGASVNTYGDYTKYRDGTPEEQKDQFDKALNKMTWDSPDLPYMDLLTKDQKEQVAKRKELRGGELVFEALRESPDERVAAAAKEKKKSPYKDAESLQKAQEAFQKDQASFSALKAQVSLEEAERLLAVRYAETMKNPNLTAPGTKDENGNVITDSWIPSQSRSGNADFKIRRDRLRKAYGK